ncbi:hypothetical protein [Mycobacterium palustre]|uniref:Uncharacterized protein n=1 Tax=Mycobacterium palustre TaxID=153971 RepID=A0A1X1Z2E1_9MYCO|nr:hypothetical protein [Mycobacterium palustre]MCV7103405.1 hypothetical protein [Mycobacterium palustre]ORW17421.1 hypothetical protein AWC19_20915 [Mycobacterium palustre]
MVSVGALEVVDDLSPARWLTESIRSFALDVGSLVPAVFAAYARVFHPARDGGLPVRWAQIARTNRRTVHPEMQFTRLIGYRSRYCPGYPANQPGVFDEAPEVGTLPADVAASLARALAGHTATAQRCWFAVWYGHGDLDEAFHGRPTFRLPQRSYHLARGPVTAAAQSVGTGPFSHRSCNLWWPDDRAWCVATDIDLDSTYLGGSQACIEEMLAASDLEAMPIAPAAGVTADSDALNPA